jgi:ABC-type nitrate/sulfonate/bicarbonate transport system substrate-binding protein
MISLRLGGVPEHFNLPWRLAIEEGIFKNQNIDLQWIDHAGGTGSMTKALQDADLDMAICLTEGIVADIVKGNKAKIVKVYVQSPLTWGIYVNALRTIQTVEELEGKFFGISRFGSGSHLMAYVKAQDLGWDTKKMQFVLLKNLEGIREGLQNNLADAFMWEKVMTQPYVDSGELRFIGECITPWSCFVLAVREDILTKHTETIKKITEIINQYVQGFKQRPHIIELLAQRYQIDLEDTAHWLHQTVWAENNDVPEAMIEKVQKTLQELEIIKEMKPYKDLVYPL